MTSEKRRAERQIKLLVEDAARAVTNDAGHFQQKALVDKFRELFEAAAKDAPHVREQGARDLAESYCGSWVTARKPKPGGEDGALFHPGYVLPLGNGERVWMERATAADLIQWAALDSDNTARINAAAGRRQAYVAGRLTEFPTHPGWVLGDIERVVFGYVEVDDRPDDDPEDLE